MIHDKFFKHFKAIPLAKQLLSILLPETIYRLFDWKTLRITDSESLLKNKSVHTDIIAEVCLLSGKPVMIYIPIEHKSYSDQDVMLQILEQFTAICRKTKSIVLPIILLCCQDKNFTIPDSYLRWVLRDHDLSTPEMQELIKWLPDFRCLVVNLHDIPPERLWQAGVPTGLLIYAMANFWTATDDTVAKIIEKSREVSNEERLYLIDILINYYENTDNGYGREEFDRIERQRWPNLPEEELLVPEILFGQERIRKEGMDKGVIIGRKEGVALGQKKGVIIGRKEGVALGQKKGVIIGRKEGIALGQKKGVIIGRKEGIALGRSEERENLILGMLKSGKMTDDVICEVAGLSKKELAQLKRKN